MAGWSHNLITAACDNQYLRLYLSHSDFFRNNQRAWYAILSDTLGTVLSRASPPSLHSKAKTPSVADTPLAPETAARGTHMLIQTLRFCDK
ncbi:hypothetical protein KIPB_016722, partial [Kipferlia bialata]|eukprot:g16722.t1